MKGMDRTRFWFVVIIGLALLTIVVVGVYTGLDNLVDNPIILKSNVTVEVTRVVPLEVTRVVLEQEIVAVPIEVTKVMTQVVEVEVPTYIEVTRIVEVPVVETVVVQSDTVTMETPTPTIAAENQINTDNPEKTVAEDSEDSFS